METVFSHASKLEEMADALEAGFRVLVLHVGVDSADLSMARVAGRVQEGGHAVPEEKVRDRFVRNGPLIRRAVLLANVGKVFDNSGVNRPPIPVLEFRSGILRFVTPFVPRWVRNIYGRELGHITD